MADVHINEVHTEMEITDSVGPLSPAEIKKLVALVIAHLKEQQHQDTLRSQDNRLQNGAYVSDLTD
jgi:rRNA maturation endonuclease Nob1